MTFKHTLLKPLLLGSVHAIRTIIDGKNKKYSAEV